METIPPPVGQLRPGCFLSPLPSDERSLHLARMLAALPLMGPDSCFCRDSAAVLHGLPLWREDLDRVHILRGAGGHGNVRGLAHGYTTRKGPVDTTVVAGLPTTTLAQTASDQMRRLPFGPALAVADAALRLGADRTELFGASRGGRGCRIATEAVKRADARSESPYESLVRAITLQHCLPLPELQVTFEDERGFVARVDFWWKKQRLIGEFDGAVKYADLLGPGETVQSVLAAQSRRQDRLEALGHRVVRWAAIDLTDGSLFAARLRESLGGAYFDHGLCGEARGFRRPPRPRTPSRPRR